MLITRRDEGLVLVTQPDHAELCGEMVECWGNDRFAPPEPREAVHLAAALHDDGWREADAEPLFNAAEARPLHFLEIEMEKHIALYGRGVERTFDREPYAGLLVSMHWTGLYRGRWGLQEGRLPWSERSRIDELQDEVVDREERRWIGVKRGLLADARRSDLETRLWHNYDLLQAWDLLSLYVCLIDLSPADGVAARPVPETLKSIDQKPGERLIHNVPLGPAGDCVELSLRAVEPGVVRVDPYPFDEPEIVFSVRGRVMPDRRYEDAQDARRALDDASEIRVTCRMVAG